MKDRSTPALVLSVVTLVLLVALVIVGGFVARAKYLRLNHLIYQNQQAFLRLETLRQINQLETGVLNVSLMRAEGITPNPKDVAALAQSIDGFNPPGVKPDSELAKQIAQWKQQMLIRLEIPGPKAQDQPPQTPAEKAPAP